MRNCVALSRRVRLVTFSRLRMTRWYDPLSDGIAKSHSAGWCTRATAVSDRYPQEGGFRLLRSILPRSRRPERATVFRSLGG
jgi:hypothetical protein